MGRRRHCSLVPEITFKIVPRLLIPKIVYVPLFPKIFCHRSHVLALAQKLAMRTPNSWKIDSNSKHNFARNLVAWKIDFTRCLM